MLCPECGSNSFVKSGFANTRGNKIQAYRCKCCDRRFIDSYLKEPPAPVERSFTPEKYKELKKEINRRYHKKRASLLKVQ